MGSCIFAMSIVAGAFFSKLIRFWPDVLHGATECTGLEAFVGRSTFDVRSEGAMVAIFVGSGAGLARGSGSLLGGAGVLGSAVQGRAGEAVSINAANGNLLIAQQDEFLAGRGLDVGISRT